MKLTCLAVGLTLLSATSAQAQRRPRVIYGEDHRQDVYASKNPMFVELSKSTAAMIELKNMRQFRRGMVSINAPTLQEYGACPTERFSKQITAANCSGFIVAPNVLVTAGHCITGPAACAKFKWVFDYRVTSADQRIVEVPETSIFSCKRIIATELNNATRNDFAVIELDRPVMNRTPLKFRRAGNIQRKVPVVVIGHPTGLPTKISDGAAVRDLSENYFVANLDTYGGNSGSAVFDAKTGVVEGILVRGETDYVKDPAKNCYVSNICPEDGCQGEEATYISNIPALRYIR